MWLCSLHNFLIITYYCKYIFKRKKKCIDFKNLSSHRNPGFSLWITLYWYIGGTIKFHYILEREACNYQKYKTQFNIWYTIIDIMFCKRDHASIYVYFFQIGEIPRSSVMGFYTVLFFPAFIFSQKDTTTWS